jgi:hypothetical protein
VDGFSEKAIFVANNFLTLKHNEFHEEHYHNQDLSHFDYLFIAGYTIDSGSTGQLDAFQG